MARGLGRGCVHVYTGDGKGKTCAALGLAVRAVGAGYRVFIGQFIKRGAFSEVRALRARLPEITLRQFGSGCFVRGRPPPAEIRRARRGLAALARALASGHYDVVIADEANCAVAAGLLAPDDLLALVAARPPGVELVLTGRDAHPRLLRRADLVTEMRCRKHYYARGVAARRGIEC